MSLFYFAVDVACVNAFILQQRLAHASTMRDQLNFRCSLVDGLLAAGTVAQHRSAVIVVPPTVKRQVREKPLPDGRTIGALHLPVWQAKQQRCALCYYRNLRHWTQVHCSHCKRTLCCSTKRNCFLEYHTTEGLSEVVPQTAEV